MINLMTEADLLCIQGVEAKRKGQYVEAFELYQRANKLQPKDPDILFNMGKVLFILGEYQSAVKAYLCCCEDVLLRNAPISNLSPNFLMHFGWAYTTYRYKETESNLPKDYSKYVPLYRASIDPYYQSKFSIEETRIQTIYDDDMESLSDVQIENAKDFIGSMIEHYKLRGITSLD